MHEAVNYFRMAEGIQPKKGEKGCPSEWLRFASIDLKGKSFLVVDASFVPSKRDGLSIKAKPGNYEAWVQGISFGHDRRVAKLRVIRSGAAASLGRKLGETWTDTATTGVIDYESFKAAWGRDDEASYERIEPALDALETVGEAVLDRKAGAVMLLVESGFGDGRFPVIELVDAGTTVGFEIEFIAEDRPYPFDPEHRAPIEPEAGETLWRAKAATGEPAAIFELGRRLVFGDGLPQDTKEGYALCSKAADLAYAPAINAIGYFHLEAIGVARSYDIARDKFLAAASQGDLYAANNLGHLYQHGRGVEKDLQRALSHYLEAANAGLPDAQFNVGLLYERGIGVLTDEAKAVDWYAKAALQGFAKAQCNLGNCYLQGKGVPRDEKAAFKWFVMGSLSNHPMSLNNLGDCYETGRGKQKDYKLAVKYYRKAAELGVSLAQESLGNLLLRGRGCKKNVAEAVDWFRKSAAQKHARAIYQLAMLHEKGTGVTKDISEASRLYEEAASLGDVDATRRFNALSCRKNKPRDNR